MPADVAVLIADDHPIVRKGLRQVIENDPALRVVDEAVNGQDALRRIAATQPDVVVLDLDMPELDGFGVVREMRRQQLGGAVIVLTMHGEADLLQAALALDIKGYVIKDSAATDIVAGIKAVHGGRYFISPELSEHLVKRDAPGRGRAGLDALTPAETKILRLIAEGKTSKQIADECFVHYRTIENHRTNISGKLGLRGSHALLKFALLNKSRL